MAHVERERVVKLVGALLVIEVDPRRTFTVHVVDRTQHAFDTVETLHEAVVADRAHGPATAPKARRRLNKRVPLTGTSHLPGRYNAERHYVS